MNMEQEKSGRCSKCGADGSCRPVGKKEFNKLLKAMLKVPPPKSWKEKREKD